MSSRQSNRPADSVFGPLPVAYKKRHWHNGSKLDVTSPRFMSLHSLRSIASRFCSKTNRTFSDLKKRVFVYHDYVDAIDFLKLAEHIHFGPSGAASPQPVLEVEDPYIF